MIVQITILTLLLHGHKINNRNLMLNGFQKKQKNKIMNEYNSEKINKTTFFLL